MKAGKEFRVVLIKPSHYDDDGYVIQWLRSPVPSNSLAVLYALIDDCRRRRVLGPETEIIIEAYDEANTVLPLEAIARRLGRADGGFVGLVGVQSNQYPRALDLARGFRAAGIATVIGGFHVSGSLALFPDGRPELDEALDLGAILFAGEAEGQMDRLLRDIRDGAARPVYNVLNALPDLSGVPVPHLPRALIRRTIGAYTSVDASRGCPFQCSFCTIINVQGRTTRSRGADDVEQVVRANLAQGVNRFIISDDNFARNPNWEAILDRLATLRRGEGLDFRLVLQVDTLCHKIQGFISKAALAGCDRVFIGLENINPKSLVDVGKRQNKIWEYRRMLDEWHAHGVLTYAGYIIGFRHDTPESLVRDIAIIKAELPIDLLEFFVLTPLPGSQLHKEYLATGQWLEADLNRFDTSHVTMVHGAMSRAEWARSFRAAWQDYYSDAHIAEIMRRARRCGVSVDIIDFACYAGAMAIEGVHPLELGYVRRKARRQRRHGLPVEPAWRFHPRRWLEIATSATRWTAFLARLMRIRLQVALPDLAWHRARGAGATAAPAVAEARELLNLYGDAVRQRYGAPGGGEAVADGSRAGAD